PFEADKTAEKIRLERLTYVKLGHYPTAELHLEVHVGRRGVVKVKVVGSRAIGLALPAGLKLRGGPPSRGDDLPLDCVARPAFRDPLVALVRCESGGEEVAPAVGPAVPAAGANPRCS